MSTHPIDPTGKDPRALAATIARLFGWKAVERSGGLKWWQKPDGIWYGTVGAWKPAQEWRCLEELAEEMLARGWWLTLRHCGDGPGRVAWFADWTHEPRKYRGLRADTVSDEAPRAACIAAIKALEGARLAEQENASP